MSLSKDKQIAYIDRTIYACFIGLVFILPVAETITIREIFIFLPATLWIYKMFLKKEVLFERNHLTMPLAIFFLIGATSLLTAADPRYSTRILFEKIGVNFLLFFMVFNNINNMKQVHNIVLSLIMGSLAHGAYSLIHYVLTVNGRFLNYFVKEGGLTAGFQSYSMFIITVIPFILFNIVTSQKTRKFAFSGLLALNLLMLFTTHERGAWLAMFVEVFVFFWFVRKKMLLFMIPLIVVILLILPSDILYHGKKGIDWTGPQEKAKTYENSTDARIIIWKFSLNEIIKHPFTGIGLGHHSFTAKYPQFRHTDIWHAHNTFLNLTLQTGLQGLFVFIFIIYRVANTYWLGIKNPTYTHTLRYWFIASLVVLFGIFTRNMFDDMYSDDHAQMFWVLTGISFAVFIKIGKLTYKDIFSRNCKLRN